MRKRVSAYTLDGVDVAAGDSISAFAANICRSSFGNSPYVRVWDFSAQSFRGPRAFETVGLPEGTLLDTPADGIGTKVVSIVAAEEFDSAAANLWAMLASDVVRYGGLPLVLSNVLDVKHLGSEGTYANQAFRRMLFGLGRIAKEQRFVIMRGETAELGDCISSEMGDAEVQFNWSGTVIGAYHPYNMITGNSLRPGQVVMAVRGKPMGFRCNGGSMIRSALRLRFGPRWWEHPEAKQVIVHTARPAALFDRFITELNGWYDPPNFRPRIKMHAIAHLSGGGIKGKFGEDILFPRNLSAVLCNLFYPPTFMRQCAAWRRLDGTPFGDEEIYATLNGGQDLLVVIDRDDISKFEQAIRAYRHLETIACGTITSESEPELSLFSRFSPSKTVVYRPGE